jgi:hypothetical protein
VLRTDEFLSGSVFRAVSVGPGDVAAGVTKALGAGGVKSSLFVSGGGAVVEGKGMGALDISGRATFFIALSEVRKCQHLRWVLRSNRYCHVLPLGAGEFGAARQSPVRAALSNSFVFACETKTVTTNATDATAIWIVPVMTLRAEPKIFDTIRWPLTASRSYAHSLG